MSGQPQGPDTGEQTRQIQAMLANMAAGGGYNPPAAGGGYGNPYGGGGGIDPLQAQAYMTMLQQYFQASMQQPGGGGMPGMMGGMPGMMGGMPGMAPYGGASMAPPEPTVSVSVEGMKFQYQLTEDDIHKVFRRYGQVRHVAVDEGASSAMVTFSTTQDAQAAINDLDGKVLNGLDGTLRISWVSQAAPAPYPPMAFPGAGLLPANSPPWAGATAPGGGGGGGGGCGGGPRGGDRGEMDVRAADGYSQAAHVKGASKYTCRFLVGIENDKDFQVARRLIGPKGTNVKRIWQQTEAKLRLRGVGSGYLEGAGQKESSEPLQLCVSCTIAEGYKQAVRQVEELLGRVYEEYRQFCHDSGMPVPDLQINLSENRLMNARAVAPGAGGAGMGAGAGGQPRQGGMGAGASPKKESRRGGRTGAKRGGRGLVDGERGEPGPHAPTEEEIETFINERNEARRSSNFAEADRIRELLHSRGVALMDEPGGRGKGAEVTTWQYWRE